MSVQAQLNTVIRRLESQGRNNGGGMIQNHPTIEVTGGGVNIYISNNEVQPTDSSTMTLSDTVDAGVYAVQARTRWILFSASSGSPVVWCEGVIDR